MAITRNREIRYDNPVDFIEHKTGKIVKSWKHYNDRMQTLIIFTDNTCLELDEGMLISNNLVFNPLPKSICVSCGEEMHISTFDWQGRCKKTLDNFWEKVRKVYWHRYSKSKP